MWGRKNRFEQGLAVAESNTAAAVEQLAGSIRERLDNPSGEQIAGALTALAERVEALELAEHVQHSRRQLQKAARKAGRRVERGGKQIAALSAQSVPDEPQGWIGPTFFGFLLGFGFGFLIARSGHQERHQS